MLDSGAVEEVDPDSPIDPAWAVEALPDWPTDPCASVVVETSAPPPVLGSEGFDGQQVPTVAERRIVAVARIGAICMVFLP